MEETFLISQLKKNYEQVITFEKIKLVKDMIIKLAVYWFITISKTIIR